MSEKRPIIIIKKKVSHGGHHGGAWKVAYADFVTAMMALFIVLWLMSASSKIQKAVGGYFKDPTGTAKMIGTNQNGSGDNFTLTKDNMEQLKDQLQMTIRESVDLSKLKDQIDMTITSEGLRIELLETDKETFFERGSPKPTMKGKELLTLMASQLGTLPNKISIEGHTDAKPYAGSGVYSNWELSTDRANSARKILQENGIGLHQISQVRGYADERLRKPDDPENSSNRRISMIVQYIEKHPEADKTQEAESRNPEEAKPKTKEEAASEKH